MNNNSALIFSIGEDKNIVAAVILGQRGGVEICGRHFSRMQSCCRHSLLGKLIEVGGGFMSKRFNNRTSAALIGLSGLLTPLLVQSEESLTAVDVVKQCYFKNAGNDQQTKLTITLKDKSGSEKKNVYARYWKDYQGKGDISDKMLLVTEYPPDAEGSKFLRWAYTRDSGKNADQWIYLPVLKKVRRVSVRDEGDSFLGSDLTYADIGARAVGEDEHVFFKTEEPGSDKFYVVESTPKIPNSLYSRRVLWFSKTSSMNDCVNTRIDYFDKNNSLIKTQMQQWQHYDNAWVWDRVEVHNVQNDHRSVFEVADVKVNSGLDDAMFSERNLLRQRSQ